MSANNWQSPLPPPPTWDANAPGFGSGDGGRQDASWTGWNASGKGYKGNGTPFMEISDRDPIPKWDYLEPGARLRPWLRELSFWRHDTSTLVHKHGVKLYKASHLGAIGRSFGGSILGGSNLFESRFGSDHRCNSSSLSIASGCRARSTGRSSLVPNDEGSESDFRGIHVTNQQQTA